MSKSSLKKISVNLEESLFKTIEKRASDLRLSLDEVINMTLQDFFYLEKVRSARDRYSKRAGQMSFNSEEEVYDQIS